MSKRIVVKKNEFDAALRRMISSKPIERTEIKTSRKKPAAIIARKN